MGGSEGEQRSKNGKEIIIKGIFVRKNLNQILKPAKEKSNGYKFIIM